MKFSFKWLKTWINTDFNAEQLAHLLTMSGLEVETITQAGAGFSQIVVAQVISVADHPDADRLKIAQVKINSSKSIQVVCGASNIKVGIKVPCALPGATLPGDIKIKSNTIRGITSNGMLCSAKELALSRLEDGLLILPSDAPLGTAMQTYLNLDDDILEIKSTPNRSDCLSIKGVAREIAALTMNDEDPIMINECPIKENTTFATYIEEPKACGKLITRVIKNVNTDVITPLWMQERLEKSDISSINFLVDVSNYVMLELGQPLHIFDLDKLSTSITARFAKQNESLTCLNGKKVTLSKDTLVIADKNGPVSIAGLIGGVYSAVSEKTHHVLIESAFFYPDVIAGKSRQYGFSSESSFRFERGVDYQLQYDAITRATELIVTYAGGYVAPLNIAEGHLPKTKEILIRQSRAEKLLGISLDRFQIESWLSRLGLKPTPQQDGFLVTAPSFRFDINIEVDIIEEIARLYGYDNIHPQITYGQFLMLNTPDYIPTKTQIFEKISHLDYQEVINYSFVDKKWEIDFANNYNPIQVMNPITSHMNVMRSTLIPSLVHNLIANCNRKQSRVRIFEIAKTFNRHDNQFIQEEYIAGLACDSALPEQWGELTRKVDFFDVKNDLEQILGNVKVTFIANEIPCLHPGQSASIIHNGIPVGFIGELHPKLVKKYNLTNAPIVFEIPYNLIARQEKIHYQPISKYQPVHRDLAFIVPENITAHQLLMTLQDRKLLAVKSIKIFDVYTGTGIPAKHKSLAVKIIFQDDNKTFQDNEVDQFIQSLIEQVKPLGINLR